MSLSFTFAKQMYTLGYTYTHYINIVIATNVYKFKQLYIDFITACGLQVRMTRQEQTHTHTHTCPPSSFRPINKQTQSTQTKPPRPPWLGV